MRALRSASSAFMGWLADRSVPQPLRASVYGLYCRITGADPREAELPLALYPSLGAFFVRRLKPEARPTEQDPNAWTAPCDGTLQALQCVQGGVLLQAKGRAYSLAELLGEGADLAGLEGAWAWTLYLSPRHYHRVHAPADSRLVDVRWIPGERRSVSPDSLARTERVLATNERAVLALESAAGRYHLVMVGALNVGRIRVVGVEPRGTPPPGSPGEFARGAELARFELGSTVVLIVPGASAERVAALAPGASVRLHQPLAFRPGMGR